MKTQEVRSKCMTPKFRVSFPHMFEPTSMEEHQPKKYSLVMLFEKKVDLSAMEKLATDTMVAKFGPKNKWPKNYKWPFRDGSEKENLDGYQNTIFINASSLQQPGLIDQSKQDIIDEKEFYAGCYARATVTCYAFDKGGNKGVAFGLQNVQKLGDGEAFTSRVAACDDFDEVDIDAVQAEAKRLDEKESEDI